MTTTETRYRTFEVKYFGASNFKGSRVKVTDLRRGGSITLPYDYEFNNAEDIGRNYLEKKGIRITGLAMMKDGCLLLSEDFTTDIK